MRLATVAALLPTELIGAEAPSQPCHAGLNGGFRPIADKALINANVGHTRYSHE